MLFSSVPFLFYFLPAVLIVYFIAPKRAKNGVLLLSSLVFYGWGEPRYLPVMLGSILQGYVFGRLIERFRNTRRAKLFLLLSVLLSLGTLAYFKYADFMIANLNALTGLSVPLLRLYNGARSKNAALSRVMKPLFYLYYPLHLFAIGLIRTFFLS